RVEHLDPPVVAVGHIHTSLSIHRQIVRKPKLAWARAALVELQEVLSARGELHNPRAPIAIAYIYAALGRERDVRGQIEPATAGPGNALAPQGHDDLPLSVRLVDRMRARVYEPNVPLGINSHSVGAAGVASGRPVHGGIARSSGHTVAR